MTSTTLLSVPPAAPTLEQEMQGTLLLFAMFGLAFLLLALGLGAGALLQALTG